MPFQVKLGSAFEIAKVTGVAIEASCVAPPAYWAFAVAVPAIVLFWYVTVAVVFSPPAPVTEAVQGS
jgi:hypothetical protein